MLFSISPFFSAYFQADFFGKTIFLAIVVTSIISWSVAIYKIKFSREAKKNSRLFEKLFKERRQNILSITLGKIDTNNPYFAIYSTAKKKSLEILNKNKTFSKDGKVYLSKGDIELIESQADSVITRETKILEKNLFWLSTIVTLAPFLGLLGTVWGILITFSHLSQDSNMLSGLSMALSTTVLGLLVAIPSLIFYNYLKNMVREFSHEMENFSNELVLTLELQYKRVLGDE